MQPTQAPLPNFDITQSLNNGSLARTGFTDLLLSSLSSGLSADVSRDDLSQVCIFLFCRTQENEPIYRVEVSFAASSPLGKAIRHTIPILLPENLLPVQKRNAIWQDVPSFSPGAPARSSNHGSADSAELLLVNNQLDGRLPARHRPFEVRLCPLPAQVITNPFCFDDLASLFPEIHEATAPSITAAVHSDNLPLELEVALASIAAPRSSGVSGNALTYVQRYVRSVLFTNTLGTPDLIGCWHPIGSFAHVFDTQSGRAELGATAFISMVDRVSSTASNQPVDLWSRVHTQQKRSILELFDLLLDAAAKHEVFARSRAQAHTLRAVDNVALERFATKRRVEMLAALSSQYLANEQGADVLLEPCWRSAAASATNLQQRLQQRLATLC